MRELLMKAWLRPLVVGMSLFIGICGGSWATMHWLSKSIHDRIETLDDLEHADRVGARDAGRDRGDDLGRRVGGEQRGSVRVATRRDDGPSGLHPGRTALLEAVERVRRELRDRFGAAADGRIGRGLNPGRESSNYLQGCTICALCRWTGHYWTEPPERENRGQSAGLPTMVEHLRADRFASRRPRSASCGQATRWTGSHRSSKPSRNPERITSPPP